MKNRACLMIGVLLLLGAGRCTAQVVYDSLAPSGWSDAEPFDSQGDELGQEILLSPSSPQTIQEFTFQYLAQNFTGNERIEIKFYQPDGPLTPPTANLPGFPTPGTVLYDSGLIQLNAVDSNGRGTITLNNLNITVPSDVVWSAQLTGLTGSQTAGLALSGTPTVGDNYGDLWAKSNGQWDGGGFPSPYSSLGAQLTVVPEPQSTAIFMLAAALLIGLRNRLTRAA